ncbi:hypothetical protein L209DRAFT_425443 [Thermothelomyces heterothallicus CBS 203.75]
MGRHYRGCIVTVTASVSSSLHPAPDVNARTAVRRLLLPVARKQPIYLVGNETSVFKFDAAIVRDFVNLETCKRSHSGSEATQYNT